MLRKRREALAQWAQPAQEGWMRKEEARAAQLLALKLQVNKPHSFLGCDTSLGSTIMQATCQEWME